MSTGPLRPTILRDLLASGRFEEARELLQTQPLRGEIMDPRRGDWAPFADMIANAIAAARGGVGEAIPFWEDLLSFMAGTLEPAWGRAHKGHIHFRIGVAAARVGNLARARREFELSYEEDRLTAIQEGRPEEFARRESAYVALCIVERIDDSDFANEADKEEFVRTLFTSFDAVLRGQIILPDAVRAAIARIAPSDESRSAALTLYEELNEARGQPVSTVTLTGSVIEALLLADLFFRRGIKTTARGDDILRVELGKLMAEAEQQGVFSADSTRVAFKLAHVFRNRLHVGNELNQRHKLVPRVAETVRGVAELAILQWERIAFPYLDEWE